MTDSTTYTATARPDGKNWVVRVNGLPAGMAGVTQGGTWDEAKSMAREVISLLLDTPEESIQVDLAHQDPEVAAVVTKATQARDKAKRAAADATRANAEAARILTRKFGIRVRDAGAMLGLSPQYVSKLAPRETR